MNLKFVLNEYILIWNLLFRQSISKELNNIKQRIWKNYKKEYNALIKENEQLLKDVKNYIPNDDTIYNIIKEHSLYEDIYKYTDKYKIELLQTWDKNKKSIIRELKTILKINIKDYTIYIVDPRLNVIEESKSKKKELCYGKKKKSKIETIIDLLYQVLRKEMIEYHKEYPDVIEAVLQLCIQNELLTRITGESSYLSGDDSLNFLKKQIYPYFLMYIGVKEEDMKNFMKRDGILFDLSIYPYQEEIKQMNLYAFIDFCIENQKYSIKIEEIEII